MTAHPLDPIFHPRTVACFGVPSGKAAWGSMFHQAMLDSGFERDRLYLVNPKAKEIAGLPAYPTLLDIPGPVDHVISLVPAPVVPQLVDQCIAKGVRSLHLFTAGFSETGDARMADVERETIARLRAAGIRTIGPNCLGLYVPASGLTFGAEFPRESGNVMVISQSGANAGEIVRSLAPRGVRFSKVVSFGNGADLKAYDFFDYAAADPQTEYVVSYLEGVQGGRLRFDAIKRCAAVKPTIILKGGLSGAGARAASSHTGSLAGSRVIFEALCRQAGAMCVESMEDLLDLTVAVATSARRVAGPRVVLVGGPGGFAVLSSDAIAAENLDLPQTPETARRALREFIPVAGTSVNNPIDATARDTEQMERMLRILAGSGAYDVIFSTALGALPARWERDAQAAARPTDEAAEAERVAERARTDARFMARMQGDLGLPIAHIQRNPYGDRARITATAAYEQGIGTFTTPGRAARAVRQVLDWRARREGLPAIL